MFRTQFIEDRLRGKLVESQLGVIIMGDQDLIK
jgi:hypothetical protein